MNLSAGRLTPAPGGDGLVVRTPNAILFVAARTPEADVAALAQTVSTAEGPAPGRTLARQLAATLAADTDDSLPAFAVLASTPDGVYIKAYGSVEVHLHGPAGEETVSGVGAFTGVDREVPGAFDLITVQRAGEATPASDPLVDMQAGSLAGSGFALAAAGSAATAPAPSPAPAPAPAAPLPVAEPAPAPAPEPAPVAEAPAPTPDPFTPNAEWAAAPEAPAAPLPVAEPPAAAPPVAEPPAAAAPPAYEPPAAAPLPVAEPPAAAPPVTEPPAAAAPPAYEPPAAAPAPEPHDHAGHDHAAHDHSGHDHGSPAAPVEPATLPPTEIPAAEPPAEFTSFLLGDLDDGSDDDDVREPLPVELDPGEVRNPEQSTSEVMVQGVVCSRGHFNDPRSRFCSSCGISMVQNTQVLTRGPRPPLGVVVFEDGATFSLSSDYVVGRQPESSPLVQSGEALPLQVDDPERSISRAHAELRLVDWDVHLVNLSETNGSFVWDQTSNQWIPIPVGQSVMLTPGMRVALGRRSAVFESSLVR